MSTLSLKVTSRKSTSGQEQWEGTVSVPGLKPTKLVRKSDYSTSFGTRSAVVSSAKTLAKKLGFSGVAEQAPLAKKAAKKSVKTTSTSKK